jgi:AraC-like DNA-binding protein
MISDTVFTTDSLAAADRLAFWQEWQGRTHAPILLSSDHPDEFEARQRTLELGAVSVWPASFRPVVFRRSPKLVRRSDPEVYHLSWLRRGVAGVTRGGTEATVVPGALHANDSSRPYTIWAGRRHQVLKSVGLVVPKDLLPLPRRTADLAIGRPMSGRSGFGALLVGALSGFTRDPGSFQPADTARLVTVLVDLVAALFAQTVDADAELTPETRTRTLTRQADAFIEQHLPDPDLTPAAVAAALHISTSYLHRLYHAEGVTVAARIREQRLHRARQDLAIPSIPVQDIAARWGFSGPAVFARAFRAAFGLSPSDHRHQVTGTPVNRAARGPDAPRPTPLP